MGSGGKLTGTKTGITWRGSSFRATWAVLLLLALARVLLHALTNGGYGFHRDELATLAEARHLDWGFVAYPPLTPFVAMMAVALFGPTTVGLRLFSGLAQAAGMVLTGLMARELGGSRRAQVVAALAAAHRAAVDGAGRAVPIRLLRLPLVGADRLLRGPFVEGGGTAWWLGIGGAAGLGLMTRYTIGFYLLAPGRGATVDARAALLQEPLAVGRRRVGPADLAAQPDLAGAAWLRRSQIPGQHPRARRAHGPGRQLPAGPDHGKQQSHDGAPVDRWPVVVFVSACRPALSPAGLDSRGDRRPVHGRPRPRILHCPGLPDAAGCRRSLG